MRPEPRHVRAMVAGAIADIHVIGEAWLKAQDDAASAALPSSNGGSPSTPDGARPWEAAGWLRRAKDLLELVRHIADEARVLWPPPPRHGQTVDGVTVGMRTNTVESCGLCNEPIGSGPGELRRIDGQPFHGKKCWWTVSRQRRV